MKVSKPLIAMLAAALIGILEGKSAVAQSHVTKGANAQIDGMTSDMRSRIEEAIERVKVAEQHGKFPPMRSVEVRKLLAGAERDLDAVTGSHRHATPNRLAVYGRLIDNVDRELGFYASPGRHASKR